MDNILKGIIKVEQQLMALDKRGTYIWDGNKYEIALFVSNNPDDYKEEYPDNILKWIRINYDDKVD